MDENTRAQLQDLLPALKALRNSLQETVQNRTFAGTSQMALKSYRGLHQRVADLLPDDFFITETLALEIDDNVSEEQVVAQVNLAASQLVTYLDDKLKQTRRGHVPPEFDTTVEFDFGELGRNLRDRILAQTKDTIRRAMADIDIDIDIDGPRGKRKERVTIRTSEDDDIDLTSSDLSGQDLSNENLADRDLSRVNLSGANLRNANLGDANLVEANLSGANLRDANLSDADLSRANLSGASLVAANLREANLSNANLTNANLDGANFRDADLTGAPLPDGSRYTSHDDLLRFGGRSKRKEMPTPPEPPTPPDSPEPPTYL